MDTHGGVMTVVVLLMQNVNVVAEALRNELANDQARWGRMKCASST